MSGWSHFRLRFARVSFPGFVESGEYGSITGGTVELSALSDLKAVATLDFAGAEVPDDSGMVRVYWSAVRDGGGEVGGALGTFLFNVSDPKTAGGLVTGTMECSSTLHVLASRKVGAPYTVKAGTQAVQLASRLVSECGLPVNNPDVSAYAVRGDHTFSADEASYLAIVNWLLDAAGYSSAWVDAYGAVQMTPYVEPSSRPVSVALAGGGVLNPEVSMSNERASAPNAVRLMYQTDEETLTAAAVDDDPSSPTSTASRGYEVTLFETVDELAGDTRAERLANLQATADRRLADAMSTVERASFGCQIVEGLEPNAGVSIRHAGIDWSGNVTSVKVELRPSMPCSVEARRFVRPSVKTRREASCI